MPRFWLGGAAPVVVGKSLNVSFAERGAKLNFNENQITGIGTDAMHGPAGHLQAGARARRYHLAVAFELPLASYHQPVLVAVIVALQADALAGVDA
jgi:hypothetical protein